jgi:biopolymer transport protein ExbB/biopolymer transport protein TolQ
VGATAPFVGLFGTIVGVIRAFQGMAASEVAGVAPVFSGVAEALVCTALGVLVAIPAIWAFNYLTDRIEVFEIEMNNSAAEIVDYCLRQIGVSRGQTNPNA